MLYVGYSLVRVLASDNAADALSHASVILTLERLLHLDVEHSLNDLVDAHRWLAVSASFYYACAHYLLTPAVLAWLWLRRPATYAAARASLVTATAAALAGYVVLPTSPPRLFGDYHDVLAETADVGWWSTSASAPRGLGGLTNQLAAMPSMHVGWAVWCALALSMCATGLLIRTAAWAHVALTVLVVIGTGNHWAIDAAVGAALVAMAWHMPAVRSNTSTTQSAAVAHEVDGARHVRS